MALSRWGVSAIIELLPVAMNLSLFLFFIGLILFSKSLTGTAGVTAVIVVVVSLTYAFYLGTSALPFLILGALIQVHYQGSWGFNSGLYSV
jgi:hypothetical protein